MAKSPSKKRRKTTAVEYRKLNSRTSPIRTTNNSSASHSTLPSNHTNDSTPFYQIHTLQNGIDLSSFCNTQLIHHVSSSNNVPNIISRMINHIQITSSHLTSFNTSSNNDDSTIPLTSFTPPVQLTNMSRCVVEDVMTIKELSDIVVLLPVTTKDEDNTHIHDECKIISKRSYIHFGSDRNKFYLFFGYVKSNPEEFNMTKNSCFKRDVMNAFTLPSNNGKGFTAVLSQVLFQSTDTQPIQTEVKIKWVDVLFGRRYGLQVWTRLDQLRDYSDNFTHVSIGNNDDELKHLNNVLSFIYDEVYGDKLSMMNLLSKYYMMMNRRNKLLYDNLNSKKDIPLKFDFKDERFKFVNDVVDQTFQRAIEKCYNDFSSVTEPLLTRTEVEYLVDTYKHHLTEHYNFMMIMLGFDKKKYFYATNT